jgi:hypothetical protein
MKDMIQFFKLTVIALFTLTSCGQTTVTSTNDILIPAEFLETSVPKAESMEWYALNNSKNEFGVNIVNGKLDIKKVNEVNECKLELSNGSLIGINRGEWGGSLTFNPDDSAKSDITIKEGNIKFLFNYKNKIYFIEGLAHMGYSGGGLFELDTIKFKYKKILDFEDAPEAFTIYRDRFLIASHENFYVVKDFKKELIFKSTFWSSLYPNSIAAIDDKNIFIGIRSGIVKLDLVTRTMKFYKND